MEDYKVNERQEGNERKARLSSITVLLLLLAIFVFPFFTYPDPRPEQAGVLVNLGIPDVGQGEENAAPAAASKPEVKPEPKPEPPKPEPKVEPKPEPKPEPVQEEKVTTTEDPEAVRIRQAEADKKRKDQEKADQKRQQEQDAKRKADAEAEAKRKAEADAEARKKAAEAAAKAKRDAESKATKDAIGGLFGGGEGKGNTGKDGSQGDPNGDPNASKLTGISTGVGGGLSGRGVARRGKITDNSQKEGQVAVKICVDGDGKVISANFTQGGSFGAAASDATIRSRAIASAKKWEFDKNPSLDKQCGTITYKFKLR